MWIVDDTEQNKIENVKATRPKCSSEYGDHTFIEIHSENIKECVDCDYEEAIIIRE